VSDAAAETTGASVARGGIWNIAAKAVPQLYLVAVSVAAARYLGPADFGRQSFIAFVAIATTMLLTAGLPHALSRYVGYALGRAEPGEARGLVQLSAWIETVAAAIGAAVLVVVGLAGAEPQWAWFLAAVVCAAGVLQRAANAVLTGLQRWREATVAGLVVGAVGAAATVLVLAAGGGITGMFAVEAAATLVVLAWTGVLARRALGALRPDVGSTPLLSREMLRFAGLTSIGVLLTFVVWRRSEVFFLAIFSSDSEIGFYSVSFAAVTALILVAEAVAGVLHPALATLFGAGALDRIRVGYGRATRLVLLSALPVTAGAAALGPELLRLLYGEEFEPAGNVLLVLIVPIPLIAVMSLASVLLSAVGRLRVPLMAAGVATVVNLGLDLALIPRHDAIGAAVASGAAQLTAGIPVIFYASQVVGGVRWAWRAVAKTVAASVAGGVVAAAIVALVGGLAGFIVALPAGLLAFLALGAALRVLPHDDARWIEETAGARIGGLVGRLARALAQPEPAPG
jgi:O-antigen/teichoic acid export membrane protein